MPKYEFDAKRWCMSMSKVHHARSDFDTASTFRSVAEEIDTLRTTVSKLEGEVEALRKAVLTIAEGREMRSGDPKMDGTFEQHPHLINRNRMMEIALAALVVEEGK